MMNAPKPTNPTRTRRSRALIALLVAALSLVLAGHAEAATSAFGVGEPVGQEVTETLPDVRGVSADQTTMVADYLKQFMFDPNHHRHGLFPKAQFNGPANRNYNLKNSRPRKFLQWEKQWFGINLGWTDDAEPTTAVKVSRWFFTRRTNDQTPLRYGETVALGYGKDPSFVRYEERTFGINLGWSHSPVFEWKLLGGHVGQPVSSGEWLAIYNKRAGDCLIHFDRTVGADIGWPSSQTWTDQLGDILTDAVKHHWKEAVAYLLAS